MTRGQRLTRKDLVAMAAERAAIKEFDGGMSREDAERSAWDELVEEIAAPLLAACCTSCGKFGVHALGLCSICYQRALRNRHRIKVRCCQHCQVQFEASRKDTQFCSATHRKAAHRLAKRQPLPRVADTMVESADARTRETGPQNLPAPDPVEAIRRELAERNDARNAAVPSITDVVRRRVGEQFAQMFADEIRANDRRIRSRNGRVWGF